MNPLLAMLNSAGSASSPPFGTASSQAEDGGGANGKPTAPFTPESRRSFSSTPTSAQSPPVVPSSSATASSSAANALLSSLLGPPPVNDAGSGPQWQQSGRALETTHQSSSAADLLARIGGDGSNGAISPSSIRRMPTQASPIGTPLSSPPLKSPTRQTQASTPALFDFQSPFDLLSNASRQEGATRTPSNAPSQKSPQKPIQAVKQGDPPSPAPKEEEAEPEFASDRNLRAFRHLAGLRASSGFDEEASSGLERSTIGTAQYYNLNLLSPQPAGPSSIYAVKVEITPISILKTVHRPFESVLGLSSPHRARWSTNSVVCAAGDLVCYITGKNKVRIIDEKTGERAVLTAEGPVRSLFVNDFSCHDRESLRLGVMTDSGVGVWSLGEQFGRIDNGAQLVARLTCQSQKTLVRASFSNSSGSEDVVLVQNDGSAALVSLSDTNFAWEESVKQTLSGPDSEKTSLVAACQSFDGSLIATIHSSKDDAISFFVSLQSTTSPNVKETVKVSSPASLQVHEVSFAALVSPPKGTTRALLLGFNRNTIVAFVDLVKGEFKKIFHLDGKEHAHFNLAHWHHLSATLVVSNSLRSSVFTLRPFAQADSLDELASISNAVADRRGEEEKKVLDDASQTIKKIRSKEPIFTFDDVQPVMRESALPEVWVSFSTDQLVDSHLRLAAYHAGGIQTVNVPDEAMRQVRKEEGSVTDGLSHLQLDDKIDAEKEDRPLNQNLQGGDEVTASTVGEAQNENLRAILATVERNILTSISALPQPHANGYNDPHGQPHVQPSAEEITRTVLQSLVPQIVPQIRASLQHGITQIVGEAVAQGLPNELQNAFMRPDVSAHLQRAIATLIVTPVQRTAMDVVTRALAPHFEDVIGELTRKVEASVEQHMTNVRKDIVAEQSKALLESEAAIRDVARQMGQLTSMVESLSRQNAKMERALNEVKEEQKVLGLNSIRSTASQPQTPSRQAHATVTASTPQSHVRPQQQASGREAQPDVEDALLAALSLPTIEQDPAPLQQALTRLEQAYGSAHLAIRTPQGALRITQPVLLALLHRLIKTLTSGPSTTLAPEQSIPWIESCSAACDRADVQIAQVFDGVRREMVEGLVQAHQQFAMANRTPWWTRERLFEGTLRYLH